MHHHLSTRARICFHQPANPSGSPVAELFGHLLSALGTALADERDLSGSACFDPAFQHWQAEADGAWGGVRARAEAVLGFCSLEPDDHMLQRVAWLVRMMMDVEKVAQLLEARHLVARFVRIARTLPLAPDIAALLHEAGALVDEIALQVSEPEPDPDVIDDTALHADVPGVPVFA